jgi:hypothetical protein
MLYANIHNTTRFSFTTSIDIGPLLEAVHFVFLIGIGNDPYQAHCSSSPRRPDSVAQFCFPCILERTVLPVAEIKYLNYNPKS